MTRDQHKPLVLIPDYRFDEEVELYDCVEGTYHTECDTACEKIQGYLGDLEVYGNRCTKCGYTVWIDPLNGGMFDDHTKDRIWEATKVLEDVLNRLGIEVEETGRENED